MKAIGTGDVLCCGGIRVSRRCGGKKLQPWHPKKDFGVLYDTRGNHMTRAEGQHAEQQGREAET